MGASQSAECGNPSQAAAQEVKRSYYELLDIDRSVTDDDIKKAYRRKALSLHPDRNFGHEEAATAEFAAVSSAYEVLADPQERAWYDSHEDAILRDIDPTTSATEGAANYESSVGFTTADDVTRLLRKFHGGVTFDDSPSGFFGFLREFFEKLGHEEEMAARRQNDDMPDYPSFGHQGDTHGDGIKQFYASWSGFSTVKSFAWRDRYRTTDAEDRRMRRLMEKENARVRKDGIAEFNDAVRSLVAFVRKRDPRYTPNTQTEAERQRVLQDASKAQAARMRAANQRVRAAAQDAIPVWARGREDDEPVGTGVEEGTFDQSSSEEEHIECVACRKVFKSEKQYESHEKSNKHRKAIQALRKKLEKEGHSVDVAEEEDEETATHRDRYDSESDQGETQGTSQNETSSNGDLNGTRGISDLTTPQAVSDTEDELTAKFKDVDFNTPSPSINHVRDQNGEHELSDAS